MDGSGRIDQAYYDSSDYFEAGGDHLLDLSSPFHQYRLKAVRDLSRPRSGERVVDLGCGWGTISLGLAPHVGQVVGVDFSERSVEICEENLSRSGSTNVEFVCADAGDSGLEAGSFDLAVAADLFEHLYPEDTARVAAEAFRLLRPGGRFAVWTPHRGHLLEILKARDILIAHDPTHVDYKSMERVQGYLTASGFDIERAYYAPSHLPGLRLVERLGQTVVPFLRRRIAVLGRKAPQTTN